MRARGWRVTTALALAGAVALASIVALVAVGPTRLVAWFRVNDVTTGQSSAYPELRPLELELPAASAWDVVLRVARDMPGWQVVAEDGDERRLRAEARTRWLGFVDDVDVWIETGGGDRSLVHVRSRSRVGRGDLGTNARRIRRFLDAVEGADR